LDGVYKLSADINCTGIDFAPIGNAAQPFTGRLEGNGYKISNLTIRRENETYVGLFGATSGARINSLTLEKIDVSGQKLVGTLVGYAANGTQLSEVLVIGNVQSLGSHPDKSHLGGLVGMLAENSHVQECMTDVVVQSASANFVGGLIGEINESTIENSAANGSVQAQHYAGGLVGYSEAGGITHSYAAGNVHALSLSGGLIGLSNNTPVKSSYWDITTSGQTYSAGGEGRNTAEMHRQHTYVDWDFTTIWAIDEGISYPRLVFG